MTNPCQFGCPKLIFKKKNTPSLNRWINRHFIYFKQGFCTLNLIRIKCRLTPNYDSDRATQWWRSFIGWKKHRIRLANNSFYSIFSNVSASGPLFYLHYFMGKNNNNFMVYLFDFTYLFLDFITISSQCLKSCSNISGEAQDMGHLEIGF